MTGKAGKMAAFPGDDDRDFLASFEAALETGEIRKPSPASMKATRARWREAVKNTGERKAITLRLQQRDIERLKVIARQRGMPYQTLVTSVLHQFANGDLKERRD